jgi:hypothetical protein
MSYQDIVSSDLIDGWRGATHELITVDNKTGSSGSVRFRLGAFIKSWSRCNTANKTSVKTISASLENESEIILGSEVSCMGA